MVSRLKIRLKFLLPFPGYSSVGPIGNLPVCLRGHLPRAALSIKQTPFIYDHQCGAHLLSLLFRIPVINSLGGPSPATVHPSGLVWMVCLPPGVSFSQVPGVTSLPSPSLSYSFSFHHVSLVALAHAALVLCSQWARTAPRGSKWVRWQKS